jgi:DNA mismatch repair ATPase MutS
MSKLINKYYNRKLKNNDKLYLFKSGNFYLFLDADASKINDLYKLKLVKLNDEVYKCGFPINSIDKYKSLFKKDKLKVVIVNSLKDEKFNYNKIIDLINELRKLDIENINLKENVKALKDML